jgi:hypothetical protein
MLICGGKRRERRRRGIVNSGSQMEFSNRYPQLGPFDPRTMIQSLDASGSGLRVAFYKSLPTPERYRHEIGIIRDAGTANECVRPILVSVVGDHIDGWPIDSPLQSLAIEERSAGAVALLVGMAGQNHWSASVEAIAGARRVIFDLACRVQLNQAPRLSSVYLAPEAMLEQPRPQELVVSDPPLLVRIGLGHNLTADISRKEVLDLHIGGPPSQPVRWKYTVELID